nr:hypothetical protein [Abalone asfa-like virus]
MERQFETYNVCNTIAIIDYDIEANWPESDVVFPNNWNIENVPINVSKMIPVGSELIDVFDIWVSDTTSLWHPFVTEKIDQFKTITLGRAKTRVCRQQQNLNTDGVPQQVYFVGADTSDRCKQGFNNKIKTFSDNWSMTKKFNPPMCLVGYYHNIDLAEQARKMFNDQYAGTKVQVLGARMVQIPPKPAID